VEAKRVFKYSIWGKNNSKSIFFTQNKTDRSKKESMKIHALLNTQNPKQ
jgi:hypothetical protein